MVFQGDGRGVDAEKEDNMMMKCTGEMTGIGMMRLKRK